MAGLSSEDREVKRRHIYPPGWWPAGWGVIVADIPLDV